MNQPAASRDPAQSPIRVGVFPSVQTAETAVERLREHGFREDEITVFCSSETQERHFNKSEHPPGEAGHRGGDVKSAATGSAIGGTLGGVAAISGLVTVAGLPVLAAGGLAGALTGSVLGGLTGAMMSRGVEKESADYFDQAVADGKILVAVELQDSPPGERLQLAADVVEGAGAEAIPLREG